jgi:hypothetical protein
MSNKDVHPGYEIICKNSCPFREFFYAVKSNEQLSDQYKELINQLNISKRKLDELTPKDDVKTKEVQ